MNRLFSNLKSAVACGLLLFTMAAMVSSCDKDDPEVPTPVIAMADLEMQLSSEGGEWTFTYSITNAPADAVATAKSSAAWLSIVSVDSKSVKIKLDENTATEPREAKVTISYLGAADAEIKVIQRAADAVENPTFDISIDKVQPYGATVTFTPQSYSGNYVFLVAKASAIDKYIEVGNLEGWIEGDIHWLKSLADASGKSLGEFLKSYSAAYALDGKATTMSYSKLDVDTEYYAYCYGLTPEGEVTTDFFKEKFTTQVVATSDITFLCEVTNIKQKSAEITVTPSKDDETYFWTYISEMDFVKYDLPFIQSTMIQNVLTEVEFGADIMDIIHTGVSSETPGDLWEGTKYHIVAWGMDEHGTATTPAVEVGTFTTLAKGTMSDCTFTIDCPQVLSDDVQVHVVPSVDTERYYVAVVAQSLTTGYNADQMAQRLINMENNRFNQGFYGAGKNWTNVDWVLTGEQTKWGRKDLEWTFNPNTPYRVYVFGVSDSGERTTNVATLDVTTAKSQQSNMTFEVELTDAKWNYAKFRITPSNKDEFYMPFLIETDELRYVTDKNGNLDEAELVEQIIHYYDNTPNYYTYQDTRELQMRWASDRDYTLLLCGWSGANTTQFYRYDFHSPKIPFEACGADVDVTYELFDANELMKIDYNRWHEYEGCCVINIRFNPNSEAAHWYGGVWMPVTNYTSTGGVDHLLTLILNPDISICDRASAMYRTLAWGETYSLSYIATDAAGNFGKWHYVEFTPTKGVNTTDPYDFWTRREAPARAITTSPKASSRVTGVKRIGEPFGAPTTPVTKKASTRARSLE